MRPTSVPPNSDVVAATDLLGRSKKPVILTGGGARAARAGEAVVGLAQRIGAAIVTTAAGRGTVDERHALMCGLVGLYTTPPVHELLSEADLLLAVGTQLEETVRMGWPELDKINVVQIDCDTSAFDRPVRVLLPLLGDAGLTLEVLGCSPFARSRRERHAVASAYKAALRTAALTEYANREQVRPVRKALSGAQAVFGDDGIFVFENGLNDIWAYHWPCSD